MITRLTTARKLEAMEGDARFEINRGVLHDLSPSGARSGMVTSNIGDELCHFAQARKLGVVIFAEAGFALERDPDTMVAPDLAADVSQAVPAHLCCRPAA